ncbi:hypothetical protein SAY86_001425 [Trapa natans]|uniref:Nudix hydrolase domain-containing protein n=1 Tax=Trapa natans TaxID=22666 RepID=A0AAN7RGH0_TRANT|nr:hypothetical protein SAY86_001425 [Trapa natans]
MVDSALVLSDSAPHCCIFGRAGKMSAIVARIGRQRQRYQDNLRLVSGCIPYRLKKVSDYHQGSIENRIEVLMVSSPNRNDLVFPKGGWEDDESVEEAACREALEEAGIRGILNETPLGVWEFRSKSRQEICSLEGGCRGYMFSLEVTEELEAWPEQENHCRRWVNIQEAFKLCRYEWMRQALERFLGVLTAETKLEVIGGPADSPLPADVVPDSTTMPPSCCITAPIPQQHPANIIPFSWMLTVKKFTLN